MAAVKRHFDAEEFEKALPLVTQALRAPMMCWKSQSVYQFGFRRPSHRFACHSTTGKNLLHDRLMVHGVVCLGLMICWLGPELLSFFLRLIKESLNILW